MPPPKKNSRSQSLSKEVAPVRLVCPVCMEVPEKVMLTDDCGHLLCESCTNQILAKDDILCPVCQQAFSRDTVRHSRFLQRETDALPTACPSEGCEWVKERSELAAHLQQCPEAVIPCPHAEEGCTANMKRKEVESHSVDCEAAVVPCLNVIDGCRENMKRKDMGTHIDVCQFQTISCPNEGCDAKMLRKDAGDHQDECPEAMVRCAHAEDGCKARMKRKLLEEHMEANKFEHLQLQVVALRAENAALKNEFTNQLKSTKVDFTKQIREMKEDYERFQDEKQRLRSRVSTLEQQRNKYRSPGGPTVLQLLARRAGNAENTVRKKSRH